MYKTGNIFLAPLTDEDSPVMFKWINNRDQVIFNSAYKPVHEKQHRNWFENIQQRADVMIFGIHEIQSGRLIGSCQLHSINSIHRYAELQIRIGDVIDRNKGYGSEAVSLLLDFAFKDLNLNRVFLYVFQNNAAAIRTYEKNGFLKEGLLRQAAYVDNEYLDVQIMAILKMDYEKTHRNSST